MNSDAADTELVSLYCPTHVAVLRESDVLASVEDSTEYLDERFATGGSSVFDDLGFDYVTSDVECCGMAGSFGYKSEYYELSIDVGAISRSSSPTRATETSSPAAPPAPNT